MKNFANFISYIFHPLLIATYGCLLIFFGLTGSIYYVFTPLKLKLIITVTVFAFTFLLPALNMLILYKLNYISSLKLDKRKERIFPLMMTALCYFGLFYMVYDLGIWPAVKLFILGAGICILCTAIIHVWWQISAHMVGFGGLIGALLALSYFLQMPLFAVLSLSIVVAGTIGFSRLYLNSHTPAQVYTGFIFGCLMQFSLFFLAQSITFV
ncbi:MAG: hypothetical protein V4506_06225 [Bacteroidota bacterium]